MQVSRRLVALGAASAILIAACGGRAATTAPSTGPPRRRPPGPASEAPASEAPASEAPSEAPSHGDYKACVAFDTGGLGDKGFNDLAMKGLDDAKALGYETAFSEAQGATDYAANIQRLIDEGCQTIVTVGFNQAQATIDATLANPDVSFAQVDAVWDETAERRDARPTSPAWTSRSTRRPCSPGYLAAGFSQSKIIGTYGGQQFPGVTRFMDGMSAGISIYNEKKGTDVKLLGWDAADADRHVRRRRQPLGRPRQGRAARQDLPRPGRGHRPPGRGRHRQRHHQGDARGRQVGHRRRHRPGPLPARVRSGDPDLRREGHRRRGARDDQEERRRRHGRRELRRHAGERRRPRSRRSTTSTPRSPPELKAEVEQLSADIAAGTVKVADYLK